MGHNQGAERMERVAEILMGLVLGATLTLVVALVVI
jgi:hypothetical protein